MTLEKGKTYATEVAINDKLVSVELECLGEKKRKGEETFFGFVNVRTGTAWWLSAKGCKVAFTEVQATAFESEQV